jgi:outer membrane protein OmpA-like peptidoglycan-associated protein/opacity protein-like surface antigen
LDRGRGGDTISVEGIMRTLVLTSLALPLAAGVAAADSTDMGVAATTPAEAGPGKLEAGVYMGGFISNYFHQFYDVTLFPTGNRPQLEDLSPELGARFAYFFNKWVGVEGEGELILTATKGTGDGAQIYGLGAQAIVQYPMRITPFVAAGAGLMHLSSDMTVLGSATHWPIHIGGGARYFVTPSVAIRADIRLLRGPSEQSPYTLNASYGEFSVGVSFVPGAHSAEPAPPPVDPDPDHDGVVGAADLCPNEPGGGNPDGCPTKDKDGDGIPDAQDKCPEQAETVNGYEDTDGCPDTIPDTDNDGINDLQDKCKDQPEDKDGFQDDDGCPDPDNDNDGILDAKDKCPNVAGPVENGGCPDSDADKDGIVDRLDNCPDEPGTEANHGCKAKQLVVLTKDQLKILDQVHFAIGTAKLAKVSSPLLDNIARVMAAHLEIWKVKVEGYTDDVGKAEKNQKLSQDRANAVVEYLVKKGVAPERLEAVGHGQDSPIGDNKTAKGREANRRVEFNIVNEQ